MHWWRKRGPRWRRSLAFNAVGAALSGTVFITAGITKFTSGAWVAVITVGLFILLALLVRRHYDVVGPATKLELHTIEVPKQSLAQRIRERGEELSRAPASEQEAVGEVEQIPEEVHHLVVVPVAVLDVTAMRALAYAASLEQPVLALHVSPTEKEAERFRDYWRLWGAHLPLEVVVSPYRAIVAPLIDYLEALHRQRRDLTLTVILPEIVVCHWWYGILHNRVAPRLRRALRHLPKIVITTIPFHVAG
ncbi:hypothetical protein AB0L63_24185 [Nocardia sp. NPDC051990]|uniref:hypothetical protein n=1 Tax=Nocardia sp. NPDC051990 TaxID=3155285 RepID=UPI003418AF78